MSKKPGRPPEKKVQIRIDRLQEALDRKNIVLRKLHDMPGAPITERTISRAKKHGCMTVKSLDKLAEFLDVDPLFLMEEVHQRFEELAEDEKELEEIRSSIKIDKHPYQEKLKREQDSFEIIKKLMVLNGFDPKNLDDLSFEEQVFLDYMFHKSVRNVLRKFFKPDSQPERESNIPMSLDEEINASQLFVSVLNKYSSDSVLRK